MFTGTLRDTRYCPQAGGTAEIKELIGNECTHDSQASMNNPMQSHVLGHQAAGGARAPRIQRPRLTFSHFHEGSTHDLN